MNRLSGADNPLRMQLSFPLSRTAGYLLLSFWLMAFQCRRVNLPLQVEYRDVVQVSPLQKSYNAGDTVFFTYHNPTKMFHRMDLGRDVFVDSFSLAVAIGVNAQYVRGVDTTGGYVGYYADPGQNAPLFPGAGSSAGYLRFDCPDSSGYYFRLAVILKKPGMYLISIQNEQFYSCPGRFAQTDNGYLIFTLDANDLNEDVFWLESKDDPSDNRRYYRDQIRAKTTMAVLVR